MKRLTILSTLVAVLGLATPQLWRTEPDNLYVRPGLAKSPGALRSYFGWLGKDFDSAMEIAHSLASGEMPREESLWCFR